MQKMGEVVTGSEVRCVTLKWARETLGVFIENYNNLLFKKGEKKRERKKKREVRAVEQTPKKKHPQKTHTKNQ